MRGRSRHVSPVALARQASEERRLHDQIQVACALDDIPLAKTLLSKLEHGRDMCLGEPDRQTQRQWWHQSQRALRLRACEKLWEDEQTRRRALHRQQERACNVVPHRATKDPFQYPFMLTPKSSKKPHRRSPGRHHRAVSFKEVVNAMNGQLFPLDPSERADDARRIAGLPILSSAPHHRKASARAELLDNLLRVVDWQQDERRMSKGKHIVREHHPIHPPLPSPPSSLVATPSSAPSRSGSWLTFGSWRSTATDITAPESPVLSPTSSLPCLPTLIDSQPERHPRCAFVRISLHDSPLSPPSPSHNTSLEYGPVSPPQSFPSLGIGGLLARRVTRSVTSIIEAAKGLQSAYITATMFTTGSTYVPPISPSQPHGSSRCQLSPRPEGYRALAKDVRKFTDSTTSISQLSEPVHFIPLVSHPSASPALSKPCVPKNALIFPSPLRPRTPPAALAYRMRPVANPAVLRLKALQNLMYARGKEWEGRAREGGLGCGKERMLGIAFEGRGRSGLGCEVRFVVA